MNCRGKFNRFVGASVSLGAVVLTMVGCGGGDSGKGTAPVVQSRNAVVGVTLASGASGSADIAVGFERTGNFTELARQTLPQDTTGRRVAFPVDLSSCIAAGSAGPVRCDVAIIVRLTDARGVRTDSSRVGPVSIVGGATVDVPIIRLRPIARLVALDTVLRVNTGSRGMARVNALDAGGQVLADRALSWRTLNTSVATVDGAGVVTAIGPGQTTVEASRDPLTVSITVVVPVVESFALSAPSVRVMATLTAQVTATISVAAGRSRRVLYRSSNTAIATVDTAGRIRGVTNGAASVTAIAEADTTARVTIPVTVDPYQAVSTWRAVQAADIGPVPGNLDGIWGPSSDALVGAGSGGISRYDGTSWRFDRTVGFSPLAITGTSLNAMWIVGTQISRFDGSAWTRETVTQNGTLRAATTAENISFAVGDNGQILRRDASGWRTMTSGTTATLRAVSAWNSGTVFAAGDRATMLRLNADAWTPVNIGRSGDIYALLVRGPNEVYAAGFDANSAYIVRFDGSSWTVMTRDAASRVYGFIAAGSNVFAYGDAGLVQRLDGDRWVRDTPVANAYGFRSGWGDQTSSVVGGFNANSRARRNGTWTTVNLSPAYSGIWAASPSFIVGGGAGGAIDLFDGTRWSTMRAESANVIRSIWGSSERDVWAVGSDTLMLRYQGTSWERVPVATGGSLWAIWGASRDTVYSVVDNGEILRFDGTSWRTIFRSPAGLRAVHGANGRVVYAVGDGGRIWRYDGRLWTQEESGTTDQLTGVFAPDSVNAFAVTSTQFLQRANGTWRSTPAPAGLTLSWVNGSGRDDVYAGGSARVYRFDGTSWINVDPSNTAGTTLSSHVFPGGGMILGSYFRRIVSGTGPLGTTPGVPR